MRILLTGITGYVGGALAPRLQRDGHELVGLARDPARAHPESDVPLVRGDVLTGAGLEEALEGADVAYYLIHSMSGAADYRRADREGAEAFGAAAREAGVRRIVYLGGLGEGSEHLDSRHKTALALAEGGVPVCYFRAAAVIGAGSESFRTVLYLVRRLPLMLTPRWVSTRTQPIAIADVLAYLAAARDLEAPLDREIQIGGPDVTTYGGMMDELARAMGRKPRPRITIPVLSPSLSSLWLGLVTPVDTGVARPLIEGLATETVVQDRSGMELFDIEPMPLARAMREAIAEKSG